MWINLRDLAAKANPVRLTESFPIDSLLPEKEQEAVPAGPLQVDVTASASAGLVKVTGELTLPMEFTCSRCLSRYCRTLRIPFREAFTQNPDKARDEEEDIQLVADDRVGLKPFFEEAVLLELPYVPVCEEACKGLNQETGENLNAYPSERQAERIDPRLAALADFFSKSE